MVADVTVTRLGPDVVPGGDRRRLRRARTSPGCGPTSSDEDVVHPRRQRRVRDARAVGSAGAGRAGRGDRRRVRRRGAADPVRPPDPTSPARPSWPSRISYAGELGWELATDGALGRPGLGCAHPRGRRASRPASRSFGYRALDSLRMEKGYRYYGTDMTMLDTPFDAGLGPFVRRDGGRSSAARRSRRRASGPRPARPPAAHDPCGHGRHGTCRSTAARPSASDGEVVGRLRSVAYGPSVGRDDRLRLPRPGVARGHRPRDWMCSTIGCRPRSSTTSASTRAGPGWRLSPTR